MAISETKGQGWRAFSASGVFDILALYKLDYYNNYYYPVKEGQRYFNLNPGRLFVQQPSKKGKGSKGSFKLLR